MKARTRGRSAPLRKPTIPLSASSVPAGYPVGVHLGGVKTFGKMVEVKGDCATIDIKGVPVQVPVSVLSVDAQSFSLVLSVRDGRVEPTVFEHRQEALGYVERSPASSVGPVPIDAPLALQLMQLLDTRNAVRPAAAPAPAAAAPAPIVVKPAATAAAPAASPVATVGQAAPAVPQIIRVHTDGSCLRNPGGPGGWAVVIQVPNGDPIELSGHDPDTTNNRMELQAAVMALRRLLELAPSVPVTVWTDSEYVEKGITKWMEGWKRRGWRKADDKAVLNVDLWQTLDALNQQARAKFQLEWAWVRGHNGDPGNERADTLAKQAANKKLH